MSLFCDTGLAERIEQAEVRLIKAGCTAARGRGARGLLLPVAGGVASIAEAGSPLNKVAGLGFAGTLTDEDVAEIELAFGDIPV